MENNHFYSEEIYIEQFLQKKTVGYFDTLKGVFLKDFSGYSTHTQFYMDCEAFNNKTTQICYVSENSEQYSYFDILKIAKNNENLAQIIFETLDGQLPEDIFDELVSDSEINKKGSFLIAKHLNKV